MSTTPSQQPSAPQPEESKAATKPTRMVIEIVGQDRVSVEFRIEDLVRRLIDPFASHCGGCYGCSGCSHIN